MLVHVIPPTSVSTTRPGNCSCVEKIGGGQETHFYKIFSFGNESSGKNINARISMNKNQSLSVYMESGKCHIILAEGR